jgi:hypothetical protein
MEDRNHRSGRKQGTVGRCADPELGKRARGLCRLSRAGGFFTLVTRGVAVLHPWLLELHLSRMPQSGRMQHRRGAHTATDGEYRK